MQFGSAGAETRVGALVDTLLGVTAGLALGSILVVGVAEGMLAACVRESRACTVWATAVEMPDSAGAGVAQAAASQTIIINV
jgi:hypothetical protein